MAALTSLAIAGGVAAAAGGIGSAIAQGNTNSRLRDQASGLDPYLQQYNQQASQYNQQAGQSLQRVQGLGRRADNLTGQIQNTRLGSQGQSDLTAAAGGARDLSALLQQYAQTGGLPSESDISAAQGQSTNLLAQERIAQQQAFEDQLVQANRQAAMSGRGINDPILRAKLAQEQTRQAALLQGKQTAMATEIARSLPGQRVSYLGQSAQALLGSAQAQQQFASNQVQSQQSALQAALQGVYGQQGLSQSLYGTQTQAGMQSSQQGLQTLLAQQGILNQQGSVFNAAMGGMGAGAGLVGQVAGIAGGR